MTSQDAHDQVAIDLFGLYVTWAVLPTMRAARKGRIFNLSSNLNRCVLERTALLITTSGALKCGRHSKSGMAFSRVIR